MLRLLAGAIDEADDREAGDPRLEMRFDLDLARLEPDESVCERAREHRLDGRREGVTQGNAFAPKVLRAGATRSDSRERRA